MRFQHPLSWYYYENILLKSDMMCLDDRPTIRNREALHQKIQVDDSKKKNDSNRFKDLTRFERGHGFGRRLQSLIRRFFNKQIKTGIDDNKYTRDGSLPPSYVAGILFGFPYGTKNEPNQNPNSHINKNYKNEFEFYKQYYQQIYSNTPQFDFIADPAIDLGFGIN